MPPSGSRKVGIEKIAAYPCSLALDLEQLARARGLDPAFLQNQLFVTARSLNPLWEDPVTMGVNAALDLIDDTDRETIELIIVATESSPDFGKPISTYIQKFCGIQPHCRNFEIKHACYGGNSALVMAAHWVLSGMNKGARVLVVTTDQSRAHFYKPWELTMGAGAVAMIVSDDPKVLELDLENHGFWTQEIADTFRPTSTAEVGNSDESMFSYLEALENAYAHFLKRAGPIDFDAYFKKNIYHVPFGGMTFRAHRSLLKLHCPGQVEHAREHFDLKTRPSILYNSQMGATYSSSIFLALMGLIDSCPDLEPGDRIGIFSYGSGSCAEFYGARIGDKARPIVKAFDLQSRLGRRRHISVKNYERIERSREEQMDREHLEVDFSDMEEHYASFYEGRRRLVLESICDYRRNYKVS
ncbi:MAG: hydroxymethylglutaryl-CoA synthase [Nitrospinae bacterium CG11_big_fil_rev_8_21_14_0_20_56_8]|nr:MAG: hydroxymethylglutaryl-CoA synthase [Nitrospinae bacterium CG11_big_fil_rev_8_21_14_0_20_56_8]